MCKRLYLEAGDLSKNHVVGMHGPAWPELAAEYEPFFVCFQDIYHQKCMVFCQSGGSAFLVCLWVPTVYKMCDFLLPGTCPYFSAHI